MKTLNFNKKSWHYWFAKMGDYDHSRPDFCHYVRSALMGMFFSAVISVFVAAAIYGTGDFIAWIIAMITTGLWFNLVPDLGAFVIGGTLIFAGTIAGLVGFSAFREKRRRAHFQKLQDAIRNGKQLVEPTPSFIVTAYRTFKDKTCFKINLS